MTWTYLTSDLATTPKDQVRLLIGDTLSTDPQLQDEEINYLLTTRTSIYGACAEACRSLATKFSRSVDQAAGTAKEAYSQMAKAYFQKAIYFDVKSAEAGAGLPYAGGISITDKSNQLQDTDRVPPQFNIGMDDNPLPIGQAGNENPEPNEDIEEEH